MTINHGENMQSYYIKPKSYYDSFGDVQPSQPYSYTYGDRPVFEFCFLPGEIAEGDTLVFAIDNDMVFYDNAPGNLLHSTSCMVVVRHYVTAEEATAGKVQLRIETRTVKFRDVTNGKVRPVEVISGLYRRRGDGDDLNYVLLAKGRAFANGIIADYDALPEPITTDEYYTKGDIDGLLGEKADVATLVAHTDNSDIHVTLQDKTTWDSKADVTDIGNATVTITQGGVSRGAFSVNATDDVTIDLSGGAQADWNETDTTSPAYIQHKPSVYTKTETDAKLGEKADKTTTYTKTETNGLLNEKADKTTTYTKDETNALLNEKADKATTIAGYGITDAYTKTEIDAKVSSVYRYRGTVSTYADLPSSGQEVGDVWNIETADSAHGIKAGDNVAWNGTSWDALAGEIDLTAYPTKSELATVATTGDYNDLTNRPDLTTKLDAPAVAGTVGQVLTKTADGQEWADAPAGGGGLSNKNYLAFKCAGTNVVHTLRIDKIGSPQDIDIEYSIDLGYTWTKYTWNGATGVEITVQGYVYFRGNNDTICQSDTNGYRFVFKDTLGAKFIAYGDVMSLLDKTGTCKEVKNYCFYGLFKDCTSLMSAPEISATIYGQLSCENMFYGCTDIEYIPNIHANFANRRAFYNMFKYCKKLTSANVEVDIANEWALYGMFYGCTGLKTFELKTLKVYQFACISMCCDCNSLESVTLSLGGNEGNQNYDSMFSYCTNLKHVLLDAHTFPSNTQNWLGNVSSYGTFRCYNWVTIPSRNSSGVPSTWSVEYVDYLTEQQQADWDEEDSNKGSYVKNRNISTETTIPDVTYTVNAGVAITPKITVASALTLNAGTVVSGKIAYSEIVLDVATGATVTAGTNMTLVDTPTAGKRNICVCRWSGGVCKLYVTIVEDLPA